MAEDIWGQDENGREKELYKLPYGATLTVNDGDKVTQGQTIASWDPHTRPIITEVKGTVQLVDFEEGVNVDKKIDEITGLSSMVILDSSSRVGAKETKPAIKLVDSKGKDLKLPKSDNIVSYSLPTGAIFLGG